MPQTSNFAVTWDTTLSGRKFHLYMLHLLITLYKQSVLQVSNHLIQWVKVKVKSHDDK